MDELTDDEMQRINDIQFEDELSAFVAALPPPSITMEGDHKAKMDYLHSIHAELFPPPPAADWEPDIMYQSKYTYEYTMSGH